MGLWDLALLGVVTLQVASIAYLPRPRLKALALGGVLVDLAEDLVPLRYQLFDTIANLVFHYLSPIWCSGRMANANIEPIRTCTMPIVASCSNTGPLRI